MKNLIAIGALLLALSAGFGPLMPGPAMAQSDSAEQAETPTAETADPAEAPAAEIIEMTLGEADAKVTLTEYASFTCPHCANFHKTTFQQLKANYIDTGKVKFIYRDVYFDRFGLWASMVARCDAERFFGISNMIYTQQRDWLGDGDPVAISRNLRKLGKVAGLEDDRLDACLADEAKAKALVAWFEANAAEDEISATPTLMIDGKQYSNMSYADLSKILDEKLAE